VALTAPYMHDGQLATLHDVVNHYSELDLDRLHADGERILEPLHLTDGEHADLIAFLGTLSDPHATGWQPRPATCRQ
jgi:cytochrome c peroxidase